MILPYFLVISSKEGLSPLIFDGMIIIGDDCIGSIVFIDFLKSTICREGFVTFALGSWN